MNYKLVMFDSLCIKDRESTFYSRPLLLSSNCMSVCLSVCLYKVTLSCRPILWRASGSVWKVEGTVKISVKMHVKYRRLMLTKQLGF